VPLEIAWPEELRLILIARFGRPRKVEPLVGQSQHSGWLVRFEKESRVIKLARGGSEPEFYREVVPRSPELARLAPSLDASVDAGGVTWLVLEWIPKPLPRERWLADPNVIAALRELHELRLDLPMMTWFVPAWTEEMSQAFLRWAPECDAAILERVRERAQTLFEPRVWISGDPNPTNWGVRPNGSLALFDWERFGRGTAALDLAITIPGLGTREDFQRVAKEYGGESPAQVAWAKAWSLVEFVAQDVARESLTRLRPLVSDWIRTLESI
jgi:hypothetical protein